MEKILLEKHQIKEDTELPPVIVRPKPEQCVGDVDYGECQRFIFSFYVKINRDLTEEQNLNEIKSQLENLEEIENLTLIYFKKYFNRLLFNEIVIDFQSDSFHAEVWGVAPRSVLRKLSNYNDAYKFSQLDN